MTSGQYDAADVLVERLGERDRKGASTVMEELAASGARPSDLIHELLAPAQRRVGGLWQSNEWNVADEHAATAIVDRLLADVGREIDLVPTLPAIVVTCAEGEWHSMPARMFAELLRAEGWLVTFLGGSTPAEHLGRFVRDARPHAVAVSCTVPIFLLGAARSVAAASQMGVPALAGGAGFGPDERRARAIGANAWAGSVSTAHETLQAWQARPPLPATPPDLGPSLALEADRADTLRAAIAELARRFPDQASDERWREETRNDLEYTLRFAEAAVLTDDTRIFRNFVSWQTELLTARAQPASAVSVQLHVLHDALPTTHSRARVLLSSEIRSTP